MSILWTCWKTFVFMSMLKSHSHIISLSHSHTIKCLNMSYMSYVYVDPWDMLNLLLSHSFNLSFTHSQHAEQLLFSCLCSNVALYRWKCQCFFWPSSILLLTLSCYIRCHRAGSQLKTFHPNSWAQSKEHGIPAWASSNYLPKGAHVRNFSYLDSLIWVERNLWHFPENANSVSITV